MARPILAGVSMGQFVVAKSSKVRFAAFAVVLLIASGLIISLFDEARAASIEFEDIPSMTTSSGTQTLIARVVVPDGEFLPIDTATAVIENRASGETSKTIASNPTVAARATCESPITGCNTAGLTGTAGTTGITRIALDDFYRESTGYRMSDGYFGTCPGGDCDLAFEGGYGYTNGGGYGYGGSIIDESPNTLTGVSEGYGYTQGGDKLLIRFEIDINPSQLGSGDYWLNFLIDTGSTTLGGILSSPATPFSVNTATVGGSSTGGDDDSSPTTPTTPTSFDAVSVTPPEGALAAFEAIISGDAGDTITIEFPDNDLLDEIELVLDSDMDDAVVDIVHYPPTNPPPGTGEAPPGVDVAGFVQVTIDAGGTTHTITITVTIPADDAGDQDRAILFKWVNDGWQPQEMVSLTENGDGSFSGSGSSTCCSDYMVGYDEQVPELAIAVAEGILEGSQTVTATAEDNVRVSLVEFFVDGSKVYETTTAPYQMTFDVDDYGDGEFVIAVKATDFAGNEAEDSETRTFQADDGTGPDDDAPPRIGANIWWILLAVLVIVVVVGVILAVQKKKGA